MQTINKGNGSGTGDTLKQAITKTADNFVEVSQRLDAAERAFPRALRGATPPPVAAFPQTPSSKGSKWTSAVRKGQLLFTGSGTIGGASILVLPSGKIVAASAHLSVNGADVLQLASISGAGALTALGVPLLLPQAVTICSWEAVGDDLFVLIAANASGSAFRAVVAASSSGLEIVASNSVAPHQGSEFNRGSRNPRALRTQNGIAGVRAHYASASSFRLAPMGMQLGPSAPSDTTVRDFGLLPTGWGGAGTSPLASDRLATDMMIVCTSALLSGAATSVATAALFTATDDFAITIDALRLSGNAATALISAIALSADRAIVRPSAVDGAIGLQVVNGKLQRLSPTVQAQGVLGRAWAAVVQQDAERALVFEQAGNAAAATVIHLDPATGTIVEEGTVALGFGTSGYPYDAFKIGPDRILVAGRAGATAAQASLEVWDLT